MFESEADGAARLAIAAVIGIGVGLEREWSAHTSGPDARFAGLRTFLLLGLLGGTTGLLAARGYERLAVAFALGGVGLAVGAYVMAMGREGTTPDGTTEAAAIGVLALSALAGVGWLTLAAGTGALMVLALTEKNRLHGLVRQLGQTEWHAAVQFAVLAVVVLPLLPAGPLLGVLAFRPRMLWTVVLLLSAVNFAGYIARRAIGAGRGYGITGALGGVISSTAVSLGFARQSRTEREVGIPLASGVIAACTVLVPRVLIVSAFLSPAVAMALVPLLVPAFVIGVVVVFLANRSGTHATPTPTADDRSPLRFRSALEMAVLFQLSMTAIAYASQLLGRVELFGMAALLGLTDVDALTVAMAGPSSGVAADIAARAIAIGVLANTLLKLGIVVVVGRSTFRAATAAGLVALAAASAVTLAL
jgi:uncharacterized membrane protein (DUF4010 family)